jgi:hypothetical protein
MAYYLVTDQELTASAAAVRQKGGTAALIPWQAGTGFKAAIDAIVSGDGEHMMLDFIFIDSDQQGHHLGLAAWNVLEARYPTATHWELVTPYHEKRNIHFYVNRCGFHITEYYNDRHRDPHYPQEEAGDYPGEDGGLFKFEKTIPRER